MMNNQMLVELSGKCEKRAKEMDTTANEFIFIFQDVVDMFLLCQRKTPKLDRGASQ